jgi:hypothetical protein
MIGRSVNAALASQGVQAGNVIEPTSESPSGSGTAATNLLAMQPTSPIERGEPLQALQPSPVPTGHVQAPPSPGRLARFRALINDFVTATCSKVPGTDARHNYLAAEAAKLEQSLNDAIDAAKAHQPMNGITKSGLIRQLEKTIKVHYELSQWKGTASERQVKLLQQCMDMHDHLQQTIAPREIHMEDLTKGIARKAHAIYFKMATGMDAERTIDGFALKGTPREASQVNLLACARAAAMNVHAEAASHKPQTLALAAVYTVGQLQELPLGDAVDGAMLTQREIDLLCANPSQNPWPVEGRLLRFYAAAKHAALEVRTREANAARREQLAQDMPPNPDPDLNVRDDQDMVADLIAGYAADLPDDRS